MSVDILVPVTNIDDVLSDVVVIATVVDEEVDGIISTNGPGASV